jgi:fucose 4-O-acetylase-like acetyltransferase
VLIVGSHFHLFMVKGGAHVLLGVAGYNFARFHLTSADRRERLRNFGRSITRIAAPSVAWLALMLLVTDDYRLTDVLLLTSLLGPHTGFWFIEALVYILAAVAAVLAVPLVDRTERRFPFAVPAALMTLGLIGRCDLFGLDARGHIPLAVTIFWLFAMGWAVAKAVTVRQRLLVTVAAMATVPGFFGQPAREAVIIAGLALLVWVRNLPSLASVNRVAGVLAGSSLYIYVTHWQVFPRLDDQFAVVSMIASLLVGIAYAALATRVMRWRPFPRERWIKLRSRWGAWARSRDREVGAQGGEYGIRALGGGEVGGVREFGECGAGDGVGDLPGMNGRGGRVVPARDHQRRGGDQRQHIAHVVRCQGVATGCVRPRVGVPQVVQQARHREAGSEPACGGRPGDRARAFATYQCCPLAPRRAVTEVRRGADHGESVDPLGVVGGEPQADGSAE